MLQVKFWKLKTWNKDEITKEIIVELIRSHENLYSKGVHVKQSFLIWNTFQAVYGDSVIMELMLQSFVTKFKPELQKYKARKCNKFYQRK